MVGAIRFELVFFYLSKIFWLFAQPTTLLILLGFVGAILVWTPWMRTGASMVMLAVVLLAICGLSPLGNALILPLENRFPRAEIEGSSQPLGLIVLGGAEDSLVTRARRQTALNEAAERLTEPATLARRFPDAPVVFTGGKVTFLYDSDSEAAGSGALLEALGLAPERLILEDRARNTAENALFTKRLIESRPELAGRRWLLITSAYHMPRAIGCFRAAGFPVEPWPVDYRTRGMSDLSRPFDRPSDGLRRVDLSTREWVGLLSYWLTGKIPELFPGPGPATPHEPAVSSQ